MLLIDCFCEFPLRKEHRALMPLTSLFDAVLHALFDFELDGVEVKRAVVRRTISIDSI